MKRQTHVCGLDVHKDTVYAAIYNGKDRSDARYLEPSPSISLS
jgi:hypothetical protein